MAGNAWNAGKIAALGRSTIERPRGLHWSRKFTGLITTGLIAAAENVEPRKAGPLPTGVSSQFRSPNNRPALAEGRVAPAERSSIGARAKRYTSVALART